LQALNGLRKKAVESIRPVRYPIGPVDRQDATHIKDINKLKPMPNDDLLEKGLIFFNSGYYFEAHEVWEELWKVTDGPVRFFYQGLIQAAVGLYHLNRGNRIGARGQIAKSIGHLTDSKDNPHGIDTGDLISQLQAIRSEMTLSSVRIVRLK
jgi:uncharacterized protein